MITPILKLNISSLHTYSLNENLDNDYYKDKEGNLLTIMAVPCPQISENAKQIIAHE